MAMTIFDGWQELSLMRSRGTNPDSEKSLVLYASMERRKHYGGFEPYVLISQVITKESHEDFRQEELYPAALQRCKLDTPLLAAGYLICGKSMNSSFISPCRISQDSPWRSAKPICQCTILSCKLA